MAKFNEMKPEIIILQVSCGQQSGEYFLLIITRHNYWQQETCKIKYASLYYVISYLQQPSLEVTLVPFDTENVKEVSQIELQSLYNVDGLWFCVSNGRTMLQVYFFVNDTFSNLMGCHLIESEGGHRIQIL